MYVVGLKCDVMIQSWASYIFGFAGMVRYRNRLLMRERTDSEAGYRVYVLFYHRERIDMGVKC